MNPMTNNELILSDLSLSRRLEKTEAKSNAAFVEARAAASPEVGAQWIEVAGAYAMFDGAGSPLTQTFGLGIHQSVTAEEMQTMEDFFRQRGADVFHEVSPLADAGAPALLNERGYFPMEFTSILYRPLSRDLRLTGKVNDKINVRLIENNEAEQELWAQTGVKGWSSEMEMTDLMLDLFRIGARKQNAPCFLAELDGQPIATGSLSIHDGVALLAGASTVPEGRRQGAQLALLEARLRYAVEQGCDLAMMGALPGSGSQRNAERQGFRIAYTRIKWQLG
ncbi:MAG TPA: GNAT family N-acetyltransferase [Blastocatellia bacterium]|nr:GNAT family N-acetyltransferase [Blastocatellia bacterium]HMV87479.1 GNAT family N-acetyltransferase [Blastocatellia bacterium]HMZ22028.1 GNAT family N-acetyltransferase [Blastocatellia bacterium]HNG33363.1 GNAT family N-acetyltransferase [Blastocatellia bacterium]